jgi:hypothetical protein
VTITEQIFQAASEQGLLFDESHLPIKIGPDCYMFSGVRSCENFSKSGQTRVERFYALTGGSTIQITQ